MSNKRENAEEDYITTPISVLRYISELESQLEEASELLDEILDAGYFESSVGLSYIRRFEQLKEKGDE